MISQHLGFFIELLLFNWFHLSFKGTVLNVVYYARNDIRYSFVIMLSNIYQIVKLYLDHSLNFEVMYLISLSDFENFKATHGSMISCNFTKKEVPYWMF